MRIRSSGKEYTYDKQERQIAHWRFAFLTTYWEATQSLIAIVVPIIIVIAVVVSIVIVIVVVPIVIAVVVFTVFSCTTGGGNGIVATLDRGQRPVDVPIGYGRLAGVWGQPCCG